MILLTLKKNKVILFLFFDPWNSNHKGKLVYAQVLYNKFNNSGLEIIGITSKEKDFVINLKQKGKFTFPLIVDENETIHRLFHIKDYCSGTVLVNRQGEIIFQAARLIEIENLRQIVEKEITGTISYDFQQIDRQALFKIKQKFPELFLKDLAGNMHLVEDIEEDHIIVTFFSSICTICKSGRRIETLKNIKRMVLKNYLKEKIILVFFEPFNERDIKEWEELVQMPFEKYISEDIFTDDEKYITDDSLKTDPLTIVLNKKREIEFIEEVGMGEQEIMERILKFIMKGSK